MIPLSNECNETKQIQILKIDNPCMFWAKSLNDKCENKKFIKLNTSLQRYFGDKSFQKPKLTSLYTGKNCIIEVDINCWKRAIIKQVILCPQGQLAQCHLVDDVQTINVDSSRIYESPEWIWEVPYQCQQYALHGIFPASYIPDYINETMILRQTFHNHRWTPAARKYFNELCEKFKTFEAKLVDKDCSGVSWVKLFLPGGNCINDLMVRFKYAVNITPMLEACVKISRKPGILNKQDKSSHKQRMEYELEKLKEEILLYNEDDITAECTEYSSNELSASDRRSEKTVSSSSEDEANNNYYNLYRNTMRPPMFLGNPKPSISRHLPFATVDTGSSSDTDTLMFPPGLKGITKPTNSRAHETMNDASSSDTDTLKSFDENIDTTIESDDDLPYMGTSHNNKGKTEEKSMSVNGQDETKRDNMKSFFTVVPTGANSSGNGDAVILIRGHTPPNRVDMVSRSPLHPKVNRIMEDEMKFFNLTNIQSLSIPIVSMKRDLLALASSNSGKTVSIAALVASRVLYVDNPSRFPVAVIVCSTWRAVLQTNSILQRFIDPDKIIALCGSTKDETNIAPKLFSGCDVIIGKPTPLNRVLGDQLTSLNNLHMLVLDDIDVLCDQYLDKIRDLMIIWQDSMRDGERKLKTRSQIACFGSRWTEKVESFATRFLRTKPLLVIADPLEAAVYGHVKHTIQLCKRETRYERLHILLRTLIDSNNPHISVITQDDEEANSIHKYLKSLSYYSMKAPQGYILADIVQMREQLEHDLRSKDHVIIVGTESVLPSLLLSDIQATVYCCCPSSEQTLGTTLGMMMDRFMIDTDKKQQPQSHFLLCKEEISKAHFLFKLFKRIGQNPPSDVSKILRVSQHMREITLKSSHPLCSYVKSYGSCRNENRCSRMHVVSKEKAMKRDIRYPELPTSGHIKVRVSCVVKACLYYCVLVAHRPTPQDDVHMYENQTEKIKDMIAADIKNNNSSQIQTCISAGDLAIDSKSNQRVQILRLSEKTVKNGKVATKTSWTTPCLVKKVCARYVDTGEVAVLRCDQLHKISEKIAKIPFQAIEVHVAGLKPADGDLDYLPHINSFIHENIYGKNLEGKIVFSLGHSIWIEPAVIRSKLDSLGCHVVDFDVRKELMQQKFAEANPNHIKRLKSLIEGNEELSDSEEEGKSSQKIREILEDECINMPRNSAVTAIPDIDNEHVETTDDCAKIHTQPEDVISIQSKSRIGDLVEEITKVQKVKNKGQIFASELDDAFEDEICSSTDHVSNNDVVSNGLLESSDILSSDSGQESSAHQSSCVSNDTSSEINVIGQQPINNNAMKNNINQIGYSGSMLRTRLDSEVSSVSAISECTSVTSTFYKQLNAPIERLYEMFCGSQSKSERRVLLNEMHMHATNSCDVTEVDMKTICAIIDENLNIEEAILLISIFMTMTNSYLPLTAFISLPRILSLLLEYLDDRILIRNKLYKRVIILVTVHLLRDSKICLISSLREMIGILHMFNSDELGTDCFQLSDKLDHIITTLIKQKEKKRRPRLKPQQIKPKITKKYDLLDYDRFNNIDTTDSDTSSIRLPYNPIPCNFDSTASSSYEESTCSSDFHPGM